MEDNLEKLSDYATDAHAMARKDFVAAHPDNVFVVASYVTLDETGFRTLAGSKSGDALPKVARIRKRAGSNAFTMMITIGRSGNNDIVLRAAGVSKFHAYVTAYGPGGAQALTDAGSSNGTVLDGKKLEPKKERAPLKSGSQVRFGDLEAVYQTPESLWDSLRLSAQAKKPAAK